MIILVLEVFFAVLVIIFLLGLIKHVFVKRADLKGKHVFITGGSSGIGKSVGVEAARRGANVTLVARDPEKLQAALAEVRSAAASSEQGFQALSVDVCGDYEQIRDKVMGSEAECGPIFMLVNCAGAAVCGALDDLAPHVITSQLNLNTVGSMLVTKAVISGMKERRLGHIVLVASQAAYCGIYGFSVYSASKFALRGFAEALNMEVSHFNIKVTVSYPPDTDTPGFHEEEKSKPRETKLISETSGLFHPSQVATKLLDDALAGRFSSNVGLDGFLLEHLCCGMAPANSFYDLVLEVFTLGLLRCIGTGYNWHFHRVVKMCHQMSHILRERKQD